MAFYGNPRLKTVTVPDSVSSVERRAFYLCERLREVNLPEKYPSLASEAFFGCSPWSIWIFRRASSPCPPACSATARG